MNLPNDLKYTKEHEWVRIVGNRATVGITDYAQSQLGDIVFIEVPMVGKAVSAGKGFSVVESVKAVSDIYAPVTGVVVAVNEALTDQPEKVNQDPYGDGWIAVIELAAGVPLEGMLDAAAYAELAVKGGH